MNYDSFDNYYDRQHFLIKENEKREIKRMGVLTGFALILSVVAQNTLFIVFYFSGLAGDYYTNATAQSAVDILLVVPGILLPFMLVSRLMKKTTGIRESLALEKPKSALATVFAVIAGLGVCMLANVVTSFISIIMSLFGVELLSPEIAMAGGAAGIFITILRVCIIAAFVEELSLRGYVMGNLRKYGDSFAVIIASVIFALMHGNLVQAPFALMVGFALGWLSIKTGSIWTGIIIHALNNLISVAVSYSTDYLGEGATNLIYTVVLYSLIFAGAVALIFFIMMTREKPLYKGTGLLSAKEKAAAFFLNVPMFIVIGYMLYATSQYINAG